MFIDKREITAMVESLLDDILPRGDFDLELKSDFISTTNDQIRETQRTQSPEDFPKTEIKLEETKAMAAEQKLQNGNKEKEVTEILQNISCLTPNFGRSLRGQYNIFHFKKSPKSNVKCQKADVNLPHTLRPFSPIGQLPNFLSISSVVFSDNI